MTSWFLFASGSARRFNGECKQLLPIRGEPLIHRTIRLIREVDLNSTIWIVTWREELRLILGCNCINTGVTPSLASAMLDTHNNWGIRNVFLMGDVIFNKECICDIWTHSHDRPVAFGKYADDKHGKPERYALAFHSNYADEVYGGLCTCISSPMCNEVPCCLMKSPMARLLNWLNRRWVTKKVNELFGAKTTSGILGYIYYNTFLVHSLAHKPPIIEIHYDEVTDIDTPKEYEDWVKTYGNIVSGV